MANWFTHFFNRSGAPAPALPDPDADSAIQFLNDKFGKDADKSLNDIDSAYEMVEPFALGTFQTKETRPRSRIDLYTTIQQMSIDPTISASTRLKVTAALGGHESRGDVVFMTPSDRIRHNDNSQIKALREQVEAEALYLMPLFNRIAFTLAKLAVDYGDSYVRVRGQKGQGVTSLQLDDLVLPFNIQAYEQGGKTVGYHILENLNAERKIAKLTTVQMARMKMPRSQSLNQQPLLPFVQRQSLEIDDITQLPIVPSSVGGSLILDAEAAWRNMNVLLGAMTNQQIADAVRVGFLQLNHEGMTPSDRKKYMGGLTRALQKKADAEKSALQGGDATWQTKYIVLPTSSEKQALNPVGDLSQRSSQITIEPLMVALRRMTGAMGLDISLVGWADMLAGGLGDGAAFHTSARIMQDSIMIRQAMNECLNHLADLHWGWKYGVTFGLDKPWQFEYYSDMSAATTEALSNKQNRLNTLALTVQALTGIKDVVKPDVAQMLLETIGGFDAAQAEQIAKGFVQAAPEGGLAPEPEEPEPDDALTEEEAEDKGADDEE